MRSECGTASPSSPIGVSECAGAVSATRFCGVPGHKRSMSMAESSRTVWQHRWTFLRYLPALTLTGGLGILLIACGGSSSTPTPTHAATTATTPTLAPAPVVNANTTPGAGSPGPGTTIGGPRDGANIGPNTTLVVTGADAVTATPSSNSGSGGSGAGRATVATVAPAPAAPAAVVASPTAAVTPIPFTPGSPTAVGAPATNGQAPAAATSAINVPAVNAPAPTVGIAGGNSGVSSPATIAPPLAASTSSP